jgi:Tfp pilus assembly protein FimT
MHSVLSILFGFTLAGLVYGLSLLPTASLSQAEETEELASRVDQESAKAVGSRTEALSQGSQVRRSDDG